MGHILQFKGGYVNELVVENKKMFFEMVNNISVQAEGLHGNFVLSVKDKPVEFSKYADITLQFAPFETNRKTLLSKLYTALENKALQAENYIKARELLNNAEAFIQHLAEDFSFDINCQRVAIGYIIKALSPEVACENKDTLEKIFDYMELVRELDRDKLFIMVNMRSYFSDTDMERFTESACLHDFKVFLLESTTFTKLKNTQRYTIDEDLCEF